MPRPSVSRSWWPAAGPTARVAVLGAVMALGPACATGPLSQLTRPASPHEEYSERLAEAGLADTALGRDWTMAGEQALRAPVEPALPFNESVYFAPEATRAVGYRL